MTTNKIQDKIEDILNHYEIGSQEHQDLMLQIMALERQLYRELVVIQHQLEDKEAA